MTERDTTVRTIRNSAVALESADDYDELIRRARGKRLVLLGESSHGTHEFYAQRDTIARRLIDELGFDAVAVEADWPDASHVNRFVRGDTSTPTADRALGGFQRFPKWMWRNDEVVRLLEWMRGRNASLPAYEHAGFFGIDLYSLHSSIEQVLQYLATVDPEASARARERYSCFDSVGRDAQKYGYATSLGAENCEDGVVRQLRELQRNTRRYVDGSPATGADDHFMAVQNARLVQSAERYYRAMFRGRVASWNLRDTHMADTIDALLKHLGRDGHESKLVVWAHNSHLGDARATEMGARGEVNLGQILRERYRDRVLSVGFTTHSGELTAAAHWNTVGSRWSLSESLPESVERLLHDTGLPCFYLDLASADVRRRLREPLLERAVGVIYRPETERATHYFKARVADQFDAVIHVDQTTAVTALEGIASSVTRDAPDTYPTSL